MPSIRTRYREIDRSFWRLRAIAGLLDWSCMASPENAIIINKLCLGIIEKMQLAPVEEKMWESLPENTPDRMFDRDIHLRYDFKETPIVTEINREKLPRLLEYLRVSDYVERRSSYQRRGCWTETMKSRLIESFILNIPVPSIVLYKQDSQHYEVLDGQQRIWAIQEFYRNKLELTGLEILPEFNGHTYKKLPQKIRATIDRRSISSVAILAELTSNSEEANFLKQKVFERLNTGRVEFSQQEVRNCLYGGLFNELLLKLARHPIFAQAWGIPTDDNSAGLEENNLYQKLEDAELVLRFFALRNIEYFRLNLEDFLDLYMIKSLNFNEADINYLEQLFIKTIEIAHQIYGQHLFKPFDHQFQNWSKKSERVYYDAIMVVLSRHLPDTTKIIAKKDRIFEETKKLFNKPESRLLTGGGTTKAEIQNRISIFNEMLSQVIGE
ncbi:DUF262 domain-containing protein [Microcoleus sp. bin38.metabat.b11b12b14.051]|uniref:DUF262 domain-containing protein n=1 Tax=Microcoleus sp. bin38.metabat.b11b12b14.051 TaxID=2742709 RepID=UPI0025EA497D|nr:DUF262 domain-containing protein [Microcoleus sp. bin38.metabat.b11b12b14.051]